MVSYVCGTAGSDIDTTCENIHVAPSKSILYVAILKLISLEREIQTGTNRFLDCMQIEQCERKHTLT